MRWGDFNFLLIFVCSKHTMTFILVNWFDWIMNLLQQGVARVKKSFAKANGEAARRGSATFTWSDWSMANHWNCFWCHWGAAAKQRSWQSGTGLQKLQASATNNFLRFATKVINHFYCMPSGARHKAREMRIATESVIKNSQRGLMTELVERSLISAPVKPQSRWLFQMLLDGGVQWSLCCTWTWICIWLGETIIEKDCDSQLETEH